MTDETTPRGKTTPTSTPGSFAPHMRRAPEVPALGENPTIEEARTLARSLEPGQSVLVTVDGREFACLVQRRDTEMGHPDHKNVTVGYGPGRWNMELNAAGIAAGSYRVRPETNDERLWREVNITDPRDPDYNTDFDMIVPGTRESYRSLILKGIDPSDQDALEDYIDQTLGLGKYNGRPDHPADEYVRWLETTLPEGSTLYVKVHSGQGSTTVPIVVHLADGRRLSGTEAFEAGINWDDVQAACEDSNDITDHPYFELRDKLAGHHVLRQNANTAQGKAVTAIRAEIPHSARVGLRFDGDQMSVERVELPGGGTVTSALDAEDHDFDWNATAEAAKQITTTADTALFRDGDDETLYFLH